MDILFRCFYVLREGRGKKEGVRGRGKELKRREEVTGAQGNGMS